MDRLLTVNQVAEWLQVKPRTIYQWVHEGYIPATKLGALVRFRPASVTQWLQKREALGRTIKRVEVDIN